MNCTIHEVYIYESCKGKDETLGQDKEKHVRCYWLAHTNSKLSYRPVFFETVSCCQHPAVRDKRSSTVQIALLQREKSKQPFSHNRGFQTHQPWPGAPLEAFAPNCSLCEPCGEKYTHLLSLRQQHVNK